MSGGSPATTAAWTSRWSVPRGEVVDGVVAETGDPEVEGHGLEPTPACGGAVACRAAAARGRSEDVHGPRSRRAGDAAVCGVVAVVAVLAVGGAAPDGRERRGAGADGRPLPGAVAEPVECCARGTERRVGGLGAAATGAALRRALRARLAGGRGATRRLLAAVRRPRAAGGRPADAGAGRSVVAGGPTGWCCGSPTGWSGQWRVRPAAGPVRGCRRTGRRRGG